jgi:hypothetical protein
LAKKSELTAFRQLLQNLDGLLPSYPIFVFKPLRNGRDCSFDVALIDRYIGQLIASI